MAWGLDPWPPANPFWLGQEKPVLREVPREARWTADGRNVEWVNRQLATFHAARRVIAEIRPKALRARMTDDLESAARQGWGVGLDDLEEALAYLWKNRGAWHDTAEAVVVLRGEKRSGPRAICNFAKAIADRHRQLERRAAEVLAIGAALGRALHDADSSVRTRIGSILSVPPAAWSLASFALKATDHYTLAGIADGLNALCETIDRVLTPLGRAASLLDAAGLAREYRAAGLPMWLGALPLLLEKLPILGEPYAEAFRQLPNWARGFNRALDPARRPSTPRGIREYLP